ncbi:MAG: hypothetical protein ACOVMQ_03350 [Cyclobacteriaceae bacterium]|jgi:hypothetical protein
MKKLIVLLFVISSLGALSQEINLPKEILQSKKVEFIVLKNGTFIECTKIKLPGPLAEYYAKVKYIAQDGKKGQIEKGDIEAILNLNKGKILYSRKFTVEDYTFLPRIQEGTVKIYEEITTTMIRTPGVAGGTTYARGTIYFIEKENKISSISGRGLFVNSKNQKETLLMLLGDNAEVKKEVESPDYKNKWDDIRRLVKQYNVEKFNLEKQLNSTKYDSIRKEELVNLTFYTEEKIEPNSYLLVNDSIKIKISSIAPAPTKLPQFRIAKVCLVNGSTTHCDLIMPLPPFQNYFEIELEEGFISLERKEERFAKRDIADNYLRSKGK